MISDEKIEWIAVAHEKLNAATNNDIDATIAALASIVEGLS